MHKKLKNIENFAKALGGKIVSNVENIESFSGKISTNSKEIEENDFFIPLIGENFDAHQFIESALEKGVGTIFEKGRVTDFRDNKIYIEVDDSLKALQLLGKNNRIEVNPKIIGITGSNGKTSTKEITFAILKTLTDKGFASKKNLNNHIGVPLNLVELDESIEVAIIEMGASALKEIDLLASLSLPDIGIITNIAPAHLEGFKSIENILIAKTELFKHTKGLKIVNNDNKYLNSIIKDYKNIESFGFLPESSLNIINIITRDMIHSIKFSFKGEKYSFKTDLPGIHNVYNLMGALLALNGLGYDMEKLVSIIPDLKVEIDGRLKKVNYKTHIIYDDSYNSNPLSVKSGVEYFYKDSKDREKILILGEMREMGEYSEHYHKEIGEFISNYHFDKIFLLGEKTKVMIPKQKLGADVTFFNSLDNLKERFHTFLNLNKNYSIYIKGSRGNHLDKILP